VQLLLNLPRAELAAHLRSAAVGLHSMRDEHFGIGVVEMLDAGLATVAHDSAGPRMDIVVPPLPTEPAPEPQHPHCLCGKSARVAVPGAGFLGASEDEYASAVVAAVRLLRAEQRAWREWVLRRRAEGLCADPAEVDALELPVSALAVMRYRAKRRARSLFSEEQFGEAVRAHVLPAVMAVIKE
jgi:alpha-1,2-mannosyltransferase